MSTYVVLAAAAATTVSLALAAGSSSEALDDPSTGWLAWLMTVVIVLATFLITAIITLVIIACLRLFRIHLPDAPHPQGAGAGASVELTRREQGGLDADAISALPLVVYRDVKQHRIVVERDGDGGDDNELECSVCLNNFLDDDMLRILPTCDHVYHPHCIDPWLKGHTNCPLCRASLLDVPEPAPQLEPQAPALQLDLEPQAPAPQLTDPSPDSSARLLIGDASEREEGEDSSRLQLLARNRRAVGLRSNSTGHDGILGDSSSRERFALRLPEHVRAEIIRTPSLRHGTSAVESSRFGEGSAHGSSLVATAVARLLPRFSPAAGLSGDGDAEAVGSSSFRRRENSARGAVGEEKRSV